MGESDGIADFEEDIEVPFEAQRLHDLPPFATMNLLHGVEQFALGISAEVMNGDDIGVHKIGGDDGFGNEHFL